ncbi:MAG: BatA domain-containing protein [bacterium]
MPSFLSTTFLMIGAAAVAVPILIHLLLRNKVVRVDFAAMRFLMESKKPIVRWLRLKQLLILLMRIIAVALLAIAFARPFFTSGAGLGLWSDQQREIGIIIDISASMNASNNLNAAKSKLQELFSQIEPETIVSVYFSGGSSRLIVEKEPYTAGISARVLSAMQPNYRQSNLREAVQFMDDLLRGSAIYTRELYIISDFQKTAWPESNNFLQLASHAKIHLRPAAEKPWQNIALIDAEIPEDKNQPWLCTVQDFSAGQISSFDVSLFVSGKRIGTQKARFTDNTSLVLQFDKAGKKGTTSGYFEIKAEGDLFPADDRYYFVANQKQAIRVLAVNGEKAAGASDELFFAERAINAKGSAFNLVKADAAKLNQLSPEAFDIVILANVTGFNKSHLQALKNFVQSGGGLLIAAGDKIDKAFYNRFFDSISPAKIIKPARERIDRSGGDILLISNINHLAVDAFSNPLNSDLSVARFYQHWRVEAHQSAQVLATFGDSSPAILATTAGRGKVVLFTFPLDAEWSDLPIQSSYLPLLHTMLAYIQPSKEKARFVQVGQPLYLGDVFTPNTPMRITTPDEIESTWQAENLIYSGTSLPGMYHFRQGSLSKNVAVNLTPEESETQLLLPEAFLANIDDGSEQTIIDKAQHASSIPDREAESEQKLWRLLLFVTIILIVSESLLANRTPR